MKVAIIGASGYSGVELFRLLTLHPKVEVELIVSRSHSGCHLREIYPHLQAMGNQELVEFSPQLIKERVELAFFATPSGVAKEYLPQLLDQGIACIDLSSDFRLRDPELYEKWYKYASVSPQYLKTAVYGLSELYLDQIRDARLVANPGCYPTASILGLAPLMAQGLIKPESIIIDGKSGVSGAGRTLSPATHFSQVNENLTAYKLGCHQHIPEIEQTLTDLAGEQVRISFATHLLPITRGLMCTIYATLASDISTEQAIQVYQGFYQEHPFVRVRTDLPSTKDVTNSNYCDIGVVVDKRTNRITVVSVIDNLIKGAAGQGVQNMNLMYGWDVKTGLHFPPSYP